MPTTDDHGFPVYTDAETMPNWDVYANTLAAALGEGLDDAAQADKDDDAVATIAALPVTGNWPGRVIMVEENDMLYVHDGTGWYIYGGKLPFYFGSRSDSSVDASDDRQAYITTTTYSRGVTMTDGVLTFETEGIYRIDQAVVWSTVNPTGQRNLGVQGDDILVLGPEESYAFPSSTVEESQAHTTYVSVLAPGATIEPYVTHNSGATLNVYGSVCVMWVTA
jgi:hypothetical protein